ncbi:MAG: hypothetical protein LBN23_04720 [Paludibacter sp.]|jgi:hypothetical protein|nr:hypothetical protein [Paludibacter sp.]
MKKTLYFITALLIFGAAQSCRNDIVMDDAPEDVFDAFWTVLDENYLFFEEKNIDWDAVYREYYPRAKAIQTKDELFELLLEIMPIFDDNKINIATSHPYYAYTEYAYNHFCVYLSRTDTVNTSENFHIGNVFMEKYGLISPKHKLNGYLLGGVWQNNVKQYTMLNSNFLPYWEHYLPNTNFDTLACRKGIIIDCRNGSGYSMDILPYFIKDSITYYNYYKTGKGHGEFGRKEKVVIRGNNNKIFEKGTPIVVLAGRATCGTNNIAVGLLKTLSNCMFVGEKTDIFSDGLRFENIVSKYLPNNWQLIFACNVKQMDDKGNCLNLPLMPDYYVEQKPEYNLPDVQDEMIVKAIQILDSINGL